MISTGSIEDVPGDWNAYRMFFSKLNTRLPRKVSLLRLESIAGQLEELAPQSLCGLE
jgi:hypothetical protein